MATIHHNFDHADPEFVPQGGQGRTLRVWFTGRDWCGVVAAEAFPAGGYPDIYHMPSPKGLDAEALKAAGWVLDFS